MKKIYILLAGLIALSTSCGTLRYEEHQSRTAQISSAGVITPTTADLNVSPDRITHTETFSHQKRENDFDVRYAKEYTLSSAMMKYKADVIVGALYNITTSEDASQVTVTITGYPANYVNFRKTTSEDSILLSVTTPSDRGEIKSSSLLSQNWGVRLGWQNMFSFVYGTSSLIGAEYTGGSRFSNWGFMGFGFGYAYDLECKDHYVPLYAQFKVYILGKKRVNPYIAINQGVAFRLAPSKTTEDFAFTVGSHTRGEIGVNFRLNPNTSLSLAYNIGTSPWGSAYGMSKLADHFYWMTPEHYIYHGLRLGITF
jgi:hypothetical protein